MPTLIIGIGVNYGTVTVGNIGSSEWHNYSAIGDVVNVVARVEGLTKDLGRKIVITESVVSRVGERFNFDPLGTHNVKGHSPVKVWGIRTARVAPALAHVEGNPRPVLLAELARGQKITVGREAQASVMYIASGKEYILKDAAEYLVKDTEISGAAGMPPIMRDIAWRTNNKVLCR